MSKSRKRREGREVGNVKGEKETEIRRKKGKKRKKKKGNKHDLKENLI